MQKKLIALAVAGLMSGAAFAQSNVVISGMLDAGVNLAKREGASRSNNAAYNNTATSIIAFKATEDLGGGMKAGAYIETNPIGGNNAGVNAMALGDFQRYVFVNGGFGELSLGQRTNFSTTTAVTAQPFGTAMGGGYSSAFGRLQGQAFNANGAMAGSTSGTRDVRAEGSVRYDSPNFNGFTAGLSWKPENDGATETTASSGHLNLGLNYAAGPLKVSYAYAKITNATAAGANTAATITATGATGLVCAAPAIAIDDGVNAVCVTPAVAGAAAYDSSSKHNMLAANYTMGPATVYFGYTTSKADTAAAAGNEFDSRSWNVGLKYAVTGNVDLMANYLKDNNKVTRVATATNSTDPDRKLFGLGADYKLSKRTAAYLRYESVDTDTHLGGVGKLTTYSMGLRHAF